VRSHLAGLDHAVLRVADLDRAAGDFARLGFTLTLLGQHSLGTENHCLMFGFDYLELLWVPPGVTPPFYAESPATGFGMTGLALKTGDAEAVRAAWERADLHPDPLIAFSRPVDIEATREAPADAPLAKFKVVALPAERTPGGRAFACEHLTPELVWRPGFRRHANHVTGINKVVIAADDPAAAGILWGRVIDVAPHPIPGGVSITTGAAPIVILEPQAIARQLPRVDLPALSGPARFAVVYLSTGDLPAAAAIVRGSGLRSVTLPDGTIALPASEAHGITLVLK